MAAVVVGSPVAAGTGRGRVVACLVSMAVVAAGTGVFDLVARPHAGTEALGPARDYVFVTLLAPFAAAMAAVLVALHRLTGGRDGRSGRTGLVVSVAGMLGFVSAAVLTLVTADASSGGPLYPLSMLATLVGMVLMSIGWVASKTAPRWVLPVLTAGWLFGGPIAEGTGPGPLAFRGAALILALICATVAMTLPRRATTGS